MKNLRIGCVGAGAMAFSIVQGILENEKKNNTSDSPYKITSITMSDISKERLQFVSNELSKYEIKIDCVVEDNVKLVDNSDVIILAVKPNHAFGVLKSVKDILEKNYDSKVLVPICAGLTIKSYFSIISEEVHIARIMPNVNCFVGESASAMALSNSSTPEDSNIVKFIFSKVGTICEVKEELMDAVTGLSGSGPAYIFQIIESLADGGVKSGLPRHIAMELAIQTVLGSAKMVKEEFNKGPTQGKHPALLKDMVCSPNGTTISGVSELENGKLRATIINAVYAATMRSKELGSEEN